MKRNDIIMKQDKKKPQKDNDDSYFIDIANSVSANECTGLIPARPINEDEQENYQELFGAISLKNNK